MNASDDNQESAHVPFGVNYVYESGLKKIEQQEKLIDSLDVKMGILIGFLGALIVGLLVGGLTAGKEGVGTAVWRPTQYIVIIGIGLVGPCLLSAYLAFRSREYKEGIKYRDLVGWTNTVPKVTKLMFLPTIEEAVAKNDELIRDKRIWVERTIKTVFAGLVILWVGLLLLGVQILRV